MLSAELSTIASKIMDSNTGKIHSLETFGAVDGPGIRFVVFFQGCPMRCIFCQNPDTWDFSQGTETTVQELVEKIKPYRPFLKKGGVTLTGGEPLAQPQFAAALLKALREEGFHTAVDTAGSLPLFLCQQAVDQADLLLLDIKALEPEMCRMICGSDGQHAKALLDYCQAQGKPVWLRHVMVPDYTLTRERLTALADYLKPYTCIQKVELLPFHQLGSYKWEEMGEPYKLKGHREPTGEEVKMAREIFTEKGFSVH